MWTNWYAIFESILSPHRTLCSKGIHSSLHITQAGHRRLVRKQTHKKRERRVIQTWQIAVGRVARSVKREFSREEYRDDNITTKRGYRVTQLGSNKGARGAGRYTGLLPDVPELPEGKFLGTYIRYLFIMHREKIPIKITVLVQYFAVCLFLKNT